MRWPFLIAGLAFASGAQAAPDDDVPPLPDTIEVSASATSTLSGKNKTYEPWYALGTDPTKFWCEGKSDEGIGEALVLKLGAPTQLDSITIRAGVWRSPELFRTNNRITQLDVVTDDGRSKKVTLPEARENVDVNLGRGAVKELKLVIQAVAKGKANDSCISGVDLHSSLAIVTDATATPPLAGAWAKAWHALDGCDDAALRAQLKFPFKYEVSGLNAHHTYKDVKAVRAACKKVEFSAFLPRQPHLVVKTESPGKVMVTDDTLEWHFVLDGGAWKLATLVDGTP
jgi:hypothetical protein